MGFMDKAKDAVDDHADKIDGGINKGSDFANEKTGGKHAEHIDGAGDKARDHLDGLDGKDDDFKNATGQNAK